jgi:hypothetical protein
MRETCRWPLGVLGFATLLSCASEEPSLVTEHVALARIALGSAPRDVACLELVAAGQRTVTRWIDVARAESVGIVTLQGLPLGAVTFSAQAFQWSCATAGQSTPTWISDPVTVTLSSDAVVQVNLRLVRNHGGSTGADAGAEVDAPPAGPDAPALEPDAPALEPDAPALEPDAPALEPDAPALEPDAGDFPGSCAAIGEEGTFRIRRGALLLDVECHTIAGGGWTRLTEAYAATLDETTPKRYLYLSFTVVGQTPTSAGRVERRWYRSPLTTSAWSWSRGVEVAGTYEAYLGLAQGLGSFGCAGSAEVPEVGIGCSSGPGGTWKVLPILPAAPSTGSCTVCQDLPNAFGDEVCRPDVAVYVREEPDEP